MALLDHFSAADGTLLSAHAMDSGHNWTHNVGNWVIQSNRAATTTLFTVCIVSATATFPDDQYAEILTEAKTTDGPICGPIVRVTGTTYYSLRIAASAGNATMSVWRVVGGAESFLQTITSGKLADVTFVAKLAVAGQGNSTVLEVFVDGVSKGTILENVGLSINSGKPGIMLDANTSVMPIIDDFGATDSIPTTLKGKSSLLMGVG